MSTIIDKAKDLGAAIASSEELAKLRNAELEMNNDGDATNIIAEFQQAQQEFQQWQATGNDLTDEHKDKAKAIEEKMTGNSKISAYMEAQREFEQLLYEINNIISLSISGQCGDGGCSAGCSSCN
ncbi:MAG: YlbF family regulator [Bacillota bacterium]|nr:YlbF family regulator [Bacillota bacterium]